MAQRTFPVSNMPQLKSSVAANASSIASTNLSPDSAVAATRRRWPRRMLVAVAASVLGVLPGIPSLAPVGPAVVQAAQPDQPHAAAPGTKTAPAALSSRSGTPPAPDKTAKKTDAPCETLKAAGPTWMHDLAPCLQGRLLSEIGIPGSHDSGTYGFQNGEGFGYATTQDEDITHQLNDGMRSFDIRVDYQTQGALGPGWYVNHGPIHSLTVDLGQIFADIRAWAIQPGHGQEIIRLSLVITGGDDKDDCRDFGENMGQQGLVTPNELQAYFGTNNPGEVTVGELWSLPNFNGIARVIMSNIPCLNEAIAANGGSSDNGQWASSDGYYAEQCTADGIEENDLQQYGVIKRVLPAAENRYSTGTGPAPPIQFGPPSPHGNLYELDVQLTPENPLDPGEPLDCAVTPLSLLPQDQQVLDALFGDYLAWQNLNIVHGDFVEQTNLWVGVVSSNQIPRAPDPPVITDHTTGVGQVTVAFSDRVSGTAPITSYDVQAFDQTTNRYVPGVSSPFTVNGLINGDTYTIYVYANNIVGRSPPSDPVEVIPGAKPRFVSGPAANGIVGQPYASGFAVTGVPVPTVSQVGRGQIPPGLTLDSHGNLTGTPTTAGRYHFAAKAVNPVGVAGLGVDITIADGVSAKITGCSTVTTAASFFSSHTPGTNAYGCALQVTLPALAVDTVFSVDIGGGGFANPSGGDRPQVTAFDGCQVAPLPSPYYPGDDGYYHYDVNISSGGCTAGAGVTLSEAITGAAGATITQAVTVPGIGASTATFVLPQAAATPTAAHPAATPTPSRPR